MPTRKHFSARVDASGDLRRSIVDALAFAREFLDEIDGREHFEAKLLVIVEELVANIVRHAVTDGELTFGLELVTIDSGIELEVVDDGAAFDPVGDFTFAGPDPLGGGGVGLELVKRLASEYSYRRAAGRNHLRILIR